MSSTILQQKVVVPAPLSSAASIGACWESKRIELEEISKKISKGSIVYIGSTASTSEAILLAMVKDWNLVDIQIIQAIPGGKLPHLKESPDRFRTSSLFSYNSSSGRKLSSSADAKNSTTSSSATTRSAQSPCTNSCEALFADYTPLSVSGLSRLLAENELKIDVAIIKVTKPHKGFCSLGLGVEASHEVIRHAKIVLAEVTCYMPWTEGNSKVSVRDIDYWVETNSPLGTTEQLWPGISELYERMYQSNVMDRIGNHIIKEIPDGATIKLDLSAAATSVLPYLKQRQNIGLHTDAYSEPLFRLQEAGVITNTEKNIDNGKSVVCLAHGSEDLYEYIDRNPAVEFHPSSYVNNPQVMAKIKNLVVVVGGLKVDLTGQVATASIGHKFYGGIYSVHDSIRGAAYSDGGKPIIALPSKSLQGRSNILFTLPPGTGVSVTQFDVEYVVTEYGTAYLYGKSIRERCLALIDIAHPDFRDELLTNAKRNRYVQSEQPGHSFMSKYPEEWETLHRTKKNKQVFVRPIKAIDEDQLRVFFHKLSDQSIYMRYFRRIRSLPQKILKKIADINYAHDMALVVLYPPRDTAHHEMVAIAQWISDPLHLHDNSNNGSSSSIDSCPEVAFQVRDDWQGEGLGKYLFLRLVEMSRFYGIQRFKADVLIANKPMNKVFETIGIPYNRRADFGVYTYVFDLTKSDK